MEGWITSIVLNFTYLADYWGLHYLSRQRFIRIFYRLLLDVL